MEPKIIKILKGIIKEENEQAQMMEGFDNALVGTGRICGGNIVPVYDAGKCLVTLVDEHSMGELEALEHFQSIVDNKEIDQVNNNKPIFINDFRKLENKNIDWTREDLFPDIEKFI